MCHSGGVSERDDGSAGELARRHFRSESFATGRDVALRPLYPGSD
jgi:hypothetical protein